MPHCKRCNLELSGEESTCPRCNFNPKQTGYRFATGGLLVVVFAVIGAQMSLFFFPAIGFPFILLAFVAFTFSFVTFLLSMMMTPYRFGGLFKRF